MGTKMVGKNLPGDPIWNSLTLNSPSQAASQIIDPFIATTNYKPPSYMVLTYCSQHAHHHHHHFIKPQINNTANRIIKMKLAGKDKVAQLTKTTNLIYE